MHIDVIITTPGGPHGKGQITESSAKFQKGWVKFEIYDDDDKKEEEVFKFEYKPEDLTIYWEGSDEDIWIKNNKI